MAQSIDVTPDRSRTWRRLRVAIRPHRWSLVLGGILSLVTGATGLALPLVVRELVDGLGEGVSIRIWLMLLSVLVVANAAVGAVGGYVLERTGESVVLSVRKGLVSHLLRLRMSVADDAEPGDLMSRVTGDTTQLRAMATQTLVSTVTATITLLATIVLMGVVDLPMLGVTLFVLVIAAVVVGVIVPRINRASKVVQESVGAMGAELERMFGAFRTVKASGAEEREETALHGAANAAWRAGVRAAKWSALAGNVAGLAIQAAFLAVLTFGGARVASGAIEVGTLIAFLLYVYYLMPPIGELTGAATQYQVGAAAISRIVEAESLPVEAVPARTVGRADTRPMSVEFDRVTFGYRKDGPPAHVDVSFDVPPGGVTAFVGPSGAGKTTVFSLIERFYRPDGGVVRVDGRDVEDWDLGELRAAIGYVEQDAPVLSGTLRENLVFAAPDVSDTDILGVVATSRLSALVETMPDGLETRVGHRGMRLSGGERQRVAIARAMLRRPRLLLLDEATSQLDAVNEAALRDTVSEIASVTTVLVVAHRLSTVTLADRIIVFDLGTVRSIGTHRELLERDALYAELAATQLLTADERS